MSHNVVTVEFGDGFRLYAINDGGGCHLYRFLLSKHEEAEAWILDSKRVIPAEPENAELSEETVVLDPDEPWAFASRASRERLWITGPRNSDEAIAETGWKTGDMYDA
ncbi:hypothetical protein [Lelliottia wanjuensis]|uniref:Uncharacterized protein n=1 Tax=Lelliottia wanjuensis TaxID=3050585 RepID=A0AAP4FRJ7_9ENTR|nr:MULTISPECIES: hypothetical protein [unclassified Lelliottia]MDK9361971.1 hypothetical protein [Lelliottia sp. V106_12]MDK9584304.1 hypothetical protein [Lelliottia sp. V86_10]MDK9617371.1 hypothetical protein [Lelliottia sp. V106_9]